MTDNLALTTEQQQFIERVGLYFEQYQLSRIGGRLLGLLLLSDRPLGVEEMATTLGVSRASVSTNIRTSADLGLTERVGLPGDRRDYYRFHEMPGARDDSADRGDTPVAPDRRSGLARPRSGHDRAAGAHLETCATSATSRSPSSTHRSIAGRSAAPAIVLTHRRSSP